MKTIVKNLLLYIVILGFVCPTMLTAQAALLSIDSTPLSTASTTAQPNVFFMMDDSQSMSMDFLPDDALAFYVDPTSGNVIYPTYGSNSVQCNGVYYDPTYTYPLPVGADGTSYPNISFTSAPYDGFGVGFGDGVSPTSTTNLATSFTADLDTAHTSVAPAFYYQYTGSQTSLVQKDYTNPNSTFMQECSSPIGSLPGSAVFTKVDVTLLPATSIPTPQQNFANWYSYYRTRINLMKSTAGLTFQALTDKFRVGFAVMNGTTFVPPATFDSTGKTAWYSGLYNVIAGNATPLIGALADVGRMYANKPLNHAYAVYGHNVPDPVQYSCQQNFTILSTDGYWNSYDGDTKIDGVTPVGEQDDATQEKPPQFDGAGAATFDITQSQILQTLTQVTQTTTQLLQRSVQYQTRTLTQTPHTLNQYDNNLSYNQFNITSTPYTLTQTQNLLTTTPYTLTQTQNLLTTTPYTLTQTQNLLTVTPYTLTSTPNLLNVTPYTLTQTPHLLNVTPYTLTQTPNLLQVTPYTLTQTPNLLQATPYTLTQTPNLLTVTPYTLTRTPQLLQATPYTLTQTPNLLQTTPYSLTQTPNLLQTTPYSLTQTQNVLQTTPYTLTQTQNLLQTTPYTLTRTPNLLQATPYTLTQTQNLLQTTPYTLTQTPNLLQVTPYTLTQTQNLLQTTPYTLTRTPQLLSYNTFFLNTTPYTLTQTTVPVLVSTGILESRIETDNSYGLYAPVSTCTWRQSGVISTSTPYVQCRYVTTTDGTTPTSTVWTAGSGPFINAGGSCTVAAASTGTADGTTWSGNAAACQYATSSTTPAISTSTGLSSCTQQSPGALTTGSTNTTYTTCAYVAGTLTSGNASCTGVTATKTIATGANSSYNLCAYSGTGTAVTGQTSCTTGSASGSSPYLSYNTGCTYSGTGTATTGLSSCVQQTASSGSPYAAYNTCAYVAGTILTAQTSCTGGTSAPAAPSSAGTYSSTNLCAYSGTAVTTSLSSCIVGTASGSSPYNAYNTCAYVAGTVLNAQTGCTGSTSAPATPSSAGTYSSTNKCTYSGTGTATTGLSSCVQQAASTGSPYASYNTCAYVAGTVLTAQTSCTGSTTAPSAPSSTGTYSSTNQCAYSGTAVTTALSSCTQGSASTSSPYASYNTCAYVAGTVLTAQTSCTGQTTTKTVATGANSSYTYCAYSGTGTATANLSSCVQQAASTSSPYASYNTCAYVAGTVLTAQTSCTGSTSAPSAPGATGTYNSTNKCTYSGTSVTAGQSSCVVGTASTSSPYAAYNTCAYVAGTVLTAQSSCSGSTSAPGSTTAVGTYNSTNKCTYSGTGTVTAGLSSCVQQAASTGSPYAAYNTCAYVAGTVLPIQASCTGSTSAPSAPGATGTYNSVNKCAYSGTGTPATGLSSCVQQAASTSSPYVSYNTCAYVAGTVLTAQTSCTGSTSAPSAPGATGTYNSTNLCAYSGTGSPTTGLSSCVQQTASAGPSFSSYNTCAYVAGTTLTAQTSCSGSTTAPAAPGATGTYNSTNLCAYSGTGTATTGLASCVQGVASTTSPYASYNVCTYVAGTPSTLQTTCTGALGAPAAPVGAGTFTSTSMCVYSGTGAATTGLASCVQQAASTSSPYVAYNTCAYAAGTVLTAQTACTGSATAPSAPGTVGTYNSTNKCIYSGTGTATTGLASCVQQTASAGPSFSSYNTCAYVAGSVVNAQTTCTGSTAAPAAPGAVGTYSSTNKCTYSGTGTLTTGLSSCIQQTASTSSPYSSYNTCTYAAETPLSAQTSCTGSTSAPAAPGTTGTYNSTNLCAYSGTGTPTAGLSTCTQQTASASSPYVSYNTCAYVAGTPLTAQTTCSGSTSLPAVTGGVNTSPGNYCVYTGTGTPTTGLASCTQQTQSGGSPFNAYNTCTYAAGTAVPLQTSCTGSTSAPTAPSVIGTTYESTNLCAYSGTPVVTTGNSTCVVGTASTSSPYASYNTCAYVAGTASTLQTSCTGSTSAPGSTTAVGTYNSTNKCTYAGSATTGTGLASCTVGSASAGPSYSAYNTCAYVAGTPATLQTSCTGSTSVPGAPSTAGTTYNSTNLCTYAGTTTTASGLASCTQQSASGSSPYSAYNTCSYNAGSSSTITPTTTAGVITQGSCSGYGTTQSVVSGANSSYTLCQYAASTPVTGQPQCISGSAGSLGGGGGTLNTYETACTYHLNTTPVATGLTGSYTVGTPNSGGVGTTFNHYSTYSYVAGTPITNPASCTAGTPGGSTAGSVDTNYSTCSYSAFVNDTQNNYNTDIAINPTLGQILYNGNYTTDGSAPGSTLLGGQYYLPAPSCSASGSASSNAAQVSCNAITSSVYVNPSSVCATQTATSSNSYTSISCSTIVTPPLPSLGTPVSSCTPGYDPVGGNNTTCTTNTFVSNYYTQTSCLAPYPSTLSSPTLANNWTTTTCAPSAINIYEVGIGGTDTSFPGSVNSLSDVAAYYYKPIRSAGGGTDNGIRSVAYGNATSNAPGYVGTDLTLCNVIPGSLDTNTCLHMTTYTLGLGARGKMIYSPTYQTDTSGDYYSVKTQATANSMQWTPYTTYPSGAYYLYSGNWYTVTTAYTSGSTFGAVDTTNTTSPSWTANTFYPVGTLYKAPSGSWYMVISAYTSGAVYSSATNGVDTTNSVLYITNGICSWQKDAAGNSGGACEWPLPVSNTLTALDDLWHAAVNGRGVYYSATNASLLAQGLTGALSSVSSLTGTQGASGTSSPNITAGDDFQFNSLYTTLIWTGDLIEQLIDVNTGVVAAYDPTNPNTYVWSARQQLENQGDAGRTIYTFNSSSTHNLMPFTATNYASNANFSTSVVMTLSQFVSGNGDSLPVWSANTAYAVGTLFSYLSNWYKVTTTYTSGNVWSSLDTTNTVADAGPGGTNLVNFLRGSHTYESAANSYTGYYRSRANILGDIVDSEAVYMKAPTQSYSDSGFTGTGSYQDIMQNRQPMVYVGGNDGMLHAFYATTGYMDPTTGLVLTAGGTAVTGGNEAWAFIPTPVLNKLYLLADKNYGQNNSYPHQYYVDGSPVIGHICPTAPASTCSASQWKTILVGGLNDGGRGYFALDITNPASPIALWEFCNSGCSVNDSNLGLSYGKPQIVKMADGTWVVMLTSGLNNVSPGDGQGHLYILNAYTGTFNTSQISSVLTGSLHATGQISDNTGSATTPSGLARFSAQVADPTADATVLQVYGGDELGNVWRFDVNGNVGGTTAGEGFVAQLLTTLSSGSAIQPIFGKPEVGLCSGHTVVFVGTGRMLGQADLTNTDQQSIYGIMDPLTDTSAPNTTAIYPNPRTDTTLFVQQTLATSLCTATEAASGLCTDTTTYDQPIVTEAYPPQPVNYSTQGGWYVDLPTPKERANTDPILALGTLAFNTNIPSNNSCEAGGSSNSYQFSYCTGGAITSTVTTDSNGNTVGVVATQLGGGNNALATRPVFGELPNGTVIEFTRLSNGSTGVTQLNTNPVSVGTHRVSWREIPAP
ncbi:MAG: PilC/PilY family type IV pilus protein [Nitrosomonadales bacterium]